MQISAEGEEGVTAVGLSHVFDVLQVFDALDGVVPRFIAGTADEVDARIQAFVEEGW